MTIDEKALEAAATAVDDLLRPDRYGPPDAHVVAEQAITAYLAARPTPDAAAMERRKPDTHAKHDEVKP